MSRELTERFEFRRQRLEADLAGIRSLLARMQPGRDPDPLDLPGLAYLLQLGYQEMEEVLKGIAQHFNELSASAAWHRELLDSMAAPSGARGQVISEALRLDLEDYLAFRHFARYTTFPVLDWAQLEPLVKRIDGVAECFNGEIEAFLSDEEL